MADPNIVESAQAIVRVNGERLHVLSFALHRELSSIDELQLRVVKYGEGLPEPTALVGQKAAFELTRTHDGQLHCVSGEVVSAELVINSNGADSLSLQVSSRLWRLQARTNCRRFLEQSTPDIVKTVLEQAGILGDEQEWRLNGDYPAHDTVAQYKETDYDFITRLLAEAGIYYAPKGHEAPGVLCFTDETAGLGPCEVGSSKFVSDFGSARLADELRHLEQRHVVRPDKVTLRDYDFTRPRLELNETVESQDEGPHDSEIYQYPGRFSEPAQGKKLAQVLLESLQADRDTVRGSTGTVSHLPGYRFSVENHPFPPLNQEYLVVAIDLVSKEQAQFENHQSEQAPLIAYDCSFVGIPTQRSAFRPPRQDAARVVAGLQTAVTGGPGGEEIHTNENGQVIAKFHWDRESARDENASTWMRTSQVPTGGSMLLPRMGWEVSVVYREGDMDQPFVMSRLYNGETPPPYALPENAGRMSLQTGTTPGDGSSNELRMSDTKGSEEMFFNASHNMSIQVGNNTTESIGNDAKTVIGSNHKLDITDSATSTVGSNQTVSVGGNQNVAVTSFMVEDIAGDHSLTVGANREKKIGGDHRRTVAGNSSLTVGANDTTMVVGSVSNNTLGNRTHTVGAALIEITPGSRSVIVGGSRLESSTALKIVAGKTGRGVTCEQGSTSIVGGAFLSSVKGNRVDECTGPISEIAAGVQIIKGKNVTFEADAMLSLTMGGASISLTPATISIVGASIKLNGNASDLGIVIDN